MAVVPLNRMLLLGSDTGVVNLLCWLKCLKYDLQYFIVIPMETNLHIWPYIVYLYLLTPL